MWRGIETTEPEQAQGAPEWMVTFSDCMTLLLTFFVLLLSFSSFDDKTFRKLKIMFGGTLSSVSSVVKKDKDAFLPAKQIKYTEELDKGSEKPTLARGKRDSLKEDTDPANFHSRKVFLISSARIFWGKGTVISSQGRKTLFTIASFLREVPSRIVVSENGKGVQKSDEHFGLRRALAVTEYLTTKQRLDKNRFSISAETTVADSQLKPKCERVLEIVLLDRSIHN